SKLGDYGAGGGDMAGLEMPDLSGLGMDGAGGLDSNGIDDLLASLFPQGDEENALFGPNLDPNQIIQQADASIFARIKKTYETFYPEWKKITDKIKPKEQKEKVASL
ncbi:MAG TPA: hypothetical protein VJL87_04680, partial [Bdellovibrionota bacterium]|nr:hypothetical protein [Bdellovibrionota bacterium]